MSGSRVKLDIDATRDTLDALGLSYAAGALDALLAEAVQAEMPAHVFLNRLLEAERSGREERRVRTMLKSAKIPTGQTLENFDFAFQPAIERSRIDTLATGAWIRNAEVILMQGPRPPWVSNRWRPHVGLLESRICHAASASGPSRSGSRCSSSASTNPSPPCARMPIFHPPG